MELTKIVKSLSDIEKNEICWQEGDVSSEAVEIKPYVGKVK